MKQKTKNILRWLALPFVATGSVFGIWLLLSKLFSILQNGILNLLYNIGISPGYYTMILVDHIFGYFLIFCVGLISFLIVRWFAPAKKSLVGWIFVLCFALLLVWLYKSGFFLPFPKRI